MATFSILQRGNIYFFYRPKIHYKEAHNLEEVRRFFVVLKPQNKRRFMILVIGRKHLPKASTYFCFVEKVLSTDKKLIDFLEEELYETSTQGTRDLSAARCLAEGKYLLINHDNNHTHLYYHIDLPARVGLVQEQFNLYQKGDYLISVKNPNLSSPTGAGLSLGQKANYPKELKNQFGDYRFIPLNPSDFLAYEGAELLLIGKDKQDLDENDPDIKKCFSKIKEEDLLKHFKAIQKPETLIPLLEKKWK